jgi:hypothetical protein
LFDFEAFLHPSLLLAAATTRPGSYGIHGANVLPFNGTWWPRGPLRSVQQQYVKKWLARRLPGERKLLQCFKWQYLKGLSASTFRQIVEEVAARQIRVDGVRTLKKSFKEDGISPFSPNVVVMRLPLPHHYKLIEGAHRVAALRELQREKPDGDWSHLTVTVCQPMSEEQQLLLADGKTFSSNLF